MGKQSKVEPFLFVFKILHVQILVRIKTFFSFPENVLFTQEVVQPNEAPDY